MKVTNTGITADTLGIQCGDIWVFLRKVLDTMFRLGAFRSILRAIPLVIAIGATLIACKPQSKVSISGRVSLEFAGTSNSETLFTLANGSSRPLTFQGWSSMLGYSVPSYSGGCRSSGQSAGTVTVIVGPVARDHSVSPRIIELSPGEQMRLAIPGYDFQPYKGGRCSITLTLEGGTVVESGEFEP